MLKQKTKQFLSFISSLPAVKIPMKMRIDIWKTYQLPVLMFGIEPLVIFKIKHKLIETQFNKSLRKTLNLGAKLNHEKAMVFCGILPFRQQEVIKTIKTLIRLYKKGALQLDFC